MFNSDQTILDWQRKQSRISRRLERAFDVEAWEDRQTARWERTRTRKALRNEKRQRVGQQRLSSSDQGSEDRSRVNSMAKEGIDRDADAVVHLAGRTTPASIAVSRQVTPLGNQPASKASSRAASSRPHSRPSSRSSSPEMIGGAAFHSTTTINEPLPWTEVQIQILEAGLKRVGGPLYDHILGLYGKRGEINNNLKDRKVLELKAKAFEMKQDFIRVGKDPPHYLASVQHPRHRSIPDLEQTQPQTTQKPDITSSQKKASRPSSNNVKKIFELSSLRTQRGTNPTQPETTVATQLYTGTARPTTASSPTTIAGYQSGKAGSGPARQPSIKPKQSSKPEPQNQPGRTEGRDVATNWSAAPAAPRRNQASNRPFKNLSHQYMTQKRDNAEPAPDLDALILIDPKTGKAPFKGSQAPPTDNNPKKTVFQTHQESLAAQQTAEAQDDVPMHDAETRSPPTKLGHLTATTPIEQAPTQLYESQSAIFLLPRLPMDCRRLPLAPIRLL